MSFDLCSRIPIQRRQISREHGLNQRDVDAGKAEAVESVSLAHLILFLSRRQDTLSSLDRLIDVVPWRKGAELLDCEPAPHSIGDRAGLGPECAVVSFDSAHQIPELVSQCHSLGPENQLVEVLSVTSSDHQS